MWLLFLHCLKQDDMQTFSIVSKIHRLCVNQFDGVILSYRFDYNKNSGDDTTKLHLDRRDITFRAEAKLFTHKIMRKRTQFQF